MVVNTWRSSRSSGSPSPCATSAPCPGAACGLLGESSLPRRTRATSGTTFPGRTRTRSSSGRATTARTTPAAFAHWLRDPNTLPGDAERRNIEVRVLCFSGIIQDLRRLLRGSERPCKKADTYHSTSLKPRTSPASSRSVHKAGGMSTLINRKLVTSYSDHIPGIHGCQQDGAADTAEQMIMTTMASSSTASPQLKRRRQV